MYGRKRAKRRIREWKPLSSTPLTLVKKTSAERTHSKKDEIIFYAFPVDYKYLIWNPSLAPAHHVFYIWFGVQPY